MCRKLQCEICCRRLRNAQFIQMQNKYKKWFYKSTGI